MTNPALPILHTIGGGSAHGLHHYMGWAQCPRKAVLDAEAAEAKVANSATNSATNVGSIAHAYLEHYYGPTHGESSHALQFSGHVAGDPDVSEAERLFRAYRKKFPRDELGLVLGVEVELPGELPAKERILNSIGIYPFTCKIDLVTEIDAKQAAHLKTTRDSDIEPGIYVIDHKTAGRRMKNEPEKWMHHKLQMKTIQLMWNACNPDRPCKGALVNLIYRRKEVGFETVVVPPVDSLAARQVQVFFSGIAELQRTLYDWPNFLACYSSYGTVCRYYETAQCRRL